MKRRVLALVAVVLVVAARSAFAQPVGTEKIGEVSFPVSCKPTVQKPFERAVALLHSFWYLESLKAFTAVTDADPDCAIAYWGAALSLWYQIWSPPSPANLKRSVELMAKAKAASATTARDRDLIAAADVFFSNIDTQDHRNRVVALQAAADPKDTTYSKQRQSAEIAEKVFAAEPDHPGAAHIIIHAYAYRELAKRGLPAAGRYAQFAPSDQDADAKRLLDEARGIMSVPAAKKYDSGRPTAHFTISVGEARWAMERGHAPRRADAAEERVLGRAGRDPASRRRGVDPARGRQVGRRADDHAGRRGSGRLDREVQHHARPIAAARGLLADMLLELGEPALAAKEYEASRQRAPNRFKAVHGVAKASQLAGDRERAKAYYTKLVALAKDDGRSEVKEARAFLAR